MVTPRAKKACCKAVIEGHGFSERRACQLMGVNRASIRYLSRKVDDMPLMDKITRIAYEKRRFGYRRIHMFLKREGTQINHKKLFRIFGFRFRLQFHL